jgi:hypothetical protein
MDAHKVDLWNFGTGEAIVVVDLGRARNFLAWGSITFTDSLAVYDRDNGAAVEVLKVDDATAWSAGFGGDHLGPEGSLDNLRPGALRAFGRRVMFRLRTFHVDDLASYGVGCVLTLD